MFASRQGNSWPRRTVMHRMMSKDDTVRADRLIGIRYITHPVHALCPAHWLVGRMPCGRMRWRGGGRFCQ
jgi:hypothetical protein